MMESGTLLLLGIIVTLIVLIALQINRSKKEREKERWETPAPRPVSGGYSPEPSVRVRMSTPSRPVSAPRTAPKPVIPQVTLYQFPAGANRVRCPGCDGENDPAYSFCWICGQRFR